MITGMGRGDRQRIQCAKMAGAIAAISDVITRDGQGRLDRLRSDWPELAERVEHAVDLVGWDKAD